MIFLLLAIIFFASVSVAMYYKYHDQVSKYDILNNDYYKLSENHRNLTLELARLTGDNVKLAEAVEKLSQKELIEECRAFYNALEQRKKDILAALNSLESSFNLVKRVYSAQTTVDDCITTIKKTPVELQTVSVSGQYDAKHIGTSWPYESKFWNGDSE